MSDRPYDINEQADRPERGEPLGFDHYEEEDASGGGPSTMDGASQSESEETRGQEPLSPASSVQRSPYIPRAIDNTALDAYMSCPAKFDMSMVQNRRAPGATRPPLAYGTTWHVIMDTHYRTGGDVEQVVAAAVKSWKQHDNPEDHRTLERAISEYGKYLQHYGTFEQETKGWGQTLGYPHEPLIEIPVEVWWTGSLHPYAGRIDRIFEYQGLIYVEDHKTTSALGANYFKQFDPSNQMMGYAVVGQELVGRPIAGVRINAHAVLKGSSKFERQTVLFSQDRLEEWKENYNYWVKRIEDSYVRSQHPVPEVAAGAFPRNFNACAGKYGQCSYTDVCTFDRNLRTRILEATYEEHPWNPLNPDGEEEA